MKNIITIILLFVLIFPSSMDAQCTGVSSVSENFDSSSNSLPTCWNGFSGGGNVSVNTNYAGYGGSQGYVVMWSNTGAATYLVLPKASAINGILSFRLQNPGSPQGGTYLDIGTMSDPNNGSTFTARTSQYIQQTGSYSYKSHNFASYMGSDEYIALKMYQSGTNTSSIVFWVDNVAYDVYAGPDQTIYVDQDATGNNDGTSWADAYTDLSNALQNSTFLLAEEIWLAEGTYTPDATDRSASFVLPNKAKVYGGFDGTEAIFEQRDPKTNITTLSGDLFGDDNTNIMHTEASRQDNSYHVVSIDGAANGVIVDGVTISGGNANGALDVSCATPAANQYYDTRGGAIYINPTTSGHNPEGTFNNCILEKNTATQSAVYSAFSPCGVQTVSTEGNFTNCIIRDNYSHESSAFIYSGSNGYNIYGYGDMVNCLFYNNVSAQQASCIYTTTSTSNGGNTFAVIHRIYHCTFSNNAGLNGHVIRTNKIANSACKMANTLIYGNGSATPFDDTGLGYGLNYCYAEGGQQSGGTDVDPLFKDPSSHDYTLQAISPAINTGNLNYPYSNAALDLAGNARNVDGQVDMGPYEAYEICKNPSNIQAQNLFHNTADISWVTDSSAYVVDLLYVESGQPVANGTTISNISIDNYTITGLMGSTAYDVYLMSSCGLLGTQVWSTPITFTTADTPLYVNQNATGANDGSSWADAFTDLQDALTLATSTNSIWVAAGTYTPGATDRKSTFLLKDETEIYGGFNGTENLFSERDYKTNETILSGDLLGDDNATILHTETTRQDNAYHVISIRGNSNNIKMNGFTITGGNANGGVDANCNTPKANQYYDTRGGAVYINPYGTNHNAQGSFYNCIFEKNTATQIAVYAAFSPCGQQNVISDANFENCIIRDNYSHELSAFNYGGSSGYSIYARGSIKNSLFYNNTSALSASCIRLSTSTSSGGNHTGIDTEVYNCTFSNNTGLNGNVIYMNRANNSKIRNSIVYGNGSATPFLKLYYGSIVSTSIVEGGQEGGTNTDPLFRDPSNHDYRLIKNSPAVDAGTTPVTISSLDLNGEERVIGLDRDMGCYEFHNIIYVDHTATGNSDGSSWADAFTDLQDALALGSDSRILIAKGTYKPTSGTGRGIAFDIPDGVEIYGGYPNGGGARDVSSNETKLSGNIDNVASYAGNSFHVVTVNSVDNVILDGLTIRDGNANNANSFGRSRGGGIYANTATLTLNNVEVKWNKGLYGAGIFATLSPNVTITNSVFKKNEGDYGSAIYHSNMTSLYLDHTEVINNNSLVRVAIEINNSLYTKIDNSLIANNESGNANAIGIITTTRDGSVDINNTTILGESLNKNLITMQIGFGDYLAMNIHNSIIGHQNPNFFRTFKEYNNGLLLLNTSHCYIQSPSVVGTSENNLYSTIDGPLILNSDYSLAACSPGIDAGSNSLSVGDYDLNGDTRFNNSIVDIGAFESGSVCRKAQTNEEEVIIVNDILKEITREILTTIEVYPNPTTGLINFKGTDLVGKDIRILNVAGKMLIQKQMQSNEVDISHLPAGFYFLSISNEEGILHTERIIKQ